MLLYCNDRREIFYIGDSNRFEFYSKSLRKNLKIRIYMNLLQKKMILCSSVTTRKDNEIQNKSKSGVTKHNFNESDCVRCR